MSDSLRYIYIYFFYLFLSSTFGLGCDIASLIRLEGQQRDHLPVGCVAVYNFAPVSGQYRQFIYLFIYFLSPRPAGPTFSLADVCVENPAVGLLPGHCPRQQWALVLTLVCKATSAKVANLLTVLK